jgi:tetratricopeptide (TPR) repeat protein
LLRLAQATRAALVVAGTYDLRGDQLEVQARVVDPWQGTVVYTAAPVRCPRADPLAGLEPLRQHVTGAVAWRSDRKFRGSWNGFHPPRYDALLEYRQGQAEHNGQDDASAVAHFEKAAALDPEFYLAQIDLVDTLHDISRCEEAAKKLVAVETNLGQMEPGERLDVRFLHAELDGRLLDVLAAVREMAALSEFPEDFNFALGLWETALNRPAEAIRALSSLPADSPALNDMRDSARMVNLAEAYHMNRDYEGQLKVARKGQHRFPNVLELYSEEAGALAALGRLDDVEKAIEACEATQGGFVFRNLGSIILTAAAELCAHGHREASLKMAKRALAWYQARPPTEAAKSQGMLMLALWRCERWADAKAIADARLAKKPDSIVLHGIVAMLAARLGDLAQARRVEEELAALTRPCLYGEHTYQRACIAAQLGEKDRALALLRDAFAQGYWFSTFVHTDMDLEPLWGYPPYEELMKPKG